MVSESMAFYDPRLKSLGCRIIAPTDSLDIDEDTLNLKLTNDDYEVIRLLYGVPEGPKELKDRLPLNMNLHLLNGISFNKGCYIGQELTQRTFHTGVLRKVAMPFVCTEKLIFKLGDESDGKYFYYNINRILSRTCTNPISIY
jgi:folate-binding protein YgfZ